MLHDNEEQRHNDCVWGPGDLGPSVAAREILNIYYICWIFHYFTTYKHDSNRCCFRSAVKLG